MSDKKINDYGLMKDVNNFFATKRTNCQIADFIINEISAASMDGQYLTECLELSRLLEKHIARDGLKWHPHPGYERGYFINYKQHFQIVVGDAYNGIVYMYIYAGTDRLKQKLILSKDTLYTEKAVAEYRNEALDLVDSWTGS